MAEVDRLTGEVARLARQTVREVEVVACNARRALARRPGDGRLARLVGELDETIIHTGRLLAQTDQRLAGNRVISDRLVSLADPDARPIRKGKPQHPTQFGYSLLVVEDERGVIADHQLQQGNPADAPSLFPPSSGWPRSPGGWRPRWSVTAGSGPPPTTAPWPSLASRGSGCSARAG
jgi:IS5 family transposase